MSDTKDYVFHQKFADGSLDHTSPFKPGYRFLDVNDQQLGVAGEEYEKRSARMRNAWRKKDAEEWERIRQEELRQRRAEENERRRQRGDAAPSRTMSTDELQARAEKVWEARNERLRNAWKKKDAA